MRIGYYVQGDMDEAVVRGLVDRWCPDAELAEGRFRGSSRESFRREIRTSLVDLRDTRQCDLLVVLTDADAAPWRTVRTREAAKIPDDCRHLTVLGVADRNIECWLAIDREALAEELDCSVEAIPDDDPSDFIKRGFGLSGRDSRQEAKARVGGFVARAPLKSWIERSDSFEEFYRDARRFALQAECRFPNELES